MDQAMNMAKLNSKKRLDRLQEKILAARKRLELKHLFDKGHEATASELMDRYELLQAELAEEVGDIESHGRRVSSLEKSVLDWINGLEFDD